MKNQRRGFAFCGLFVAVIAIALVSALVPEVGEVVGKIVDAAASAVKGLAG